MPYPSSQGNLPSGLPASAFDVKIDTTVADTTSSSNMIDVSTLSLAEGSNRIFEPSGLVDTGTTHNDGLGFSCTFSYFGRGDFAAGTAITIAGVVCKITAVSDGYAVGDKIKTSVTAVKDIIPA